MSGMPIYEYRCKACEKTFEVIQRFDDGPLRKCRECSGKLEKLVSRSAFLLKGGGWYAEGYSGGGAKKSSTKTTKSDSSSSSSSSSDSSSSKSKSASGGSKD
jgi:putative FmdB family regulatory protein